MISPNQVLTSEEIKMILNSSEWGVLSTSNDNFPYGVPVNYVYIEEDNALYIHGGKEGKKLNNIANNPNVSFVIVPFAKLTPERFTMKFESVIVYGMAEMVQDEEEKVNYMYEICKKLSPEMTEKRGRMVCVQMPAVRIIKIAISEISGKKNG